MEKLEPKKKRSPIESLKFQRKSDYKKFRNFIKKKTKELEGVTEPKDDKLKSILKVGVGGIGLLALGGLLRGKGRGKGDGEGNFPFAIGRVNPPTPRLPTIPNPRKRNPVKLKSPKSPVTRRGVEVYRRGKETKKTQARQQIKRKVRGKKIFKKQLVTQSIGDVAKKPKTLVRTQKRITSVTRGADYAGTRGTGFKYGPGDARFESGSFDPSNTERQFRNRGGRKINKKFGSDASVNIPKSVYDEVRRIEKQLARTRSASKIERLTKRLQDIERNSGGRISTKFKSTRPGVFDFSKRNPFKRFNVASNPMISKNTFKKGFMKNIFDSKVTKDTILKLPTKGKILSKAGMFINHPIPKTISFILTAYEAYQEGKSIINFKDNLFTRLYDLGVAINNELIHPDDPSKMKLFISESSNDKIRKHDILRNAKILELRKQQAQGAGGGNNVIVVPENQQNNQVKTNIPIKKGETEVSFIPFEPLNSVGTDILLHKLNQ
jgi:hypothetical protein